MSTAPGGRGERAWFDSARVERLRERAAILREVRAFFDGRGFLEVQTPLVVPSPGLDLHLAAFEVATDAGPRWLITSPEYQMKRVVAGGVARVYQVCKTFRREELGALHEPEFTMLEWYDASEGASAETTMAQTEQLVAALARARSGEAACEVDGRRIDLRPPWPRVRVDDAYRELAGCSMWDLLPDEERFFRAMVERVQPALGAERPVFLTHWPASMASLARLSPDEPTLALRYEAFIAGIELCNGFDELTDAAEQRARLERDQHARREAGLPVYPIDARFLAALEEGLPPCSGNALGVDRLVMLLTGAACVQDVLAIPHARL
ncbi:MAG: EF-P lysine aminoacylase GenX [Myxococcales bacterium]|nr:EF-P lysine aminoacylase GenX [Myxococcales bacterium]